MPKQPIVTRAIVGSTGLALAACELERTIEHARRPARKRRGGAEAMRVTPDELVAFLTTLREEAVQDFRAQPDDSTGASRCWTSSTAICGLPASARSGSGKTAGSGASPAMTANAQLRNSVIT